MYCETIENEYMVVDTGTSEGTQIKFRKGKYWYKMDNHGREVLAGMDAMEERIEYTIRFVWESCGLDVTDYFRKIFTLDMITLNEDRHLNNLAVLFCGNHVEAAPIFDNGVSLLTANQSVNWNFPIEENVKRVVARPFSGSHESLQSNWK